MARGLLIRVTHPGTTRVRLFVSVCLSWCAVGVGLAASGQTPGTQRWRFDPEGPGAWSAPSVGPDGTVYVALCERTGNGVVYALDGVAGNIKWRFRSKCFSSTPAVGVDGTVYVGCGDQQVYAFAGADGSVRWTYSAGGFSFEASPALGADGTVYIGCDDNNLYALDGTSGTKRWKFSTRGAIHEAPAVGVDGTVYTGSTDGTLYALDGATGSKKWGFATGGPIICSPAIGDDGTVYFGSADHKVYALEGTTGKERWEYATDGAVDWSPELADNMLVIGSNDGVMYSLEADTGAQCWSLPLLSPFSRAHPTSGTDGNLYFGGPRWMVALDHITKDPAWLFTTQTTNNLSAMIGADGTVYFGSDDGPFYAVWSDSLGGLADGPWPAAGQNVRHTGQAPSSPRILNQPSSQVVALGGTTMLSAIAVGVPPLNFQWMLNGKRVANATNAALILTNLQKATLGDYTLVVSNHFGAATSEPATLGLSLPPTITLQPRDQTALTGGSVKFTVSATGTSPLNYQWQLNTTNLTGATQPELSLTNVGPANAGVYRAVVSNIAGSASSSGALLVVHAPAALAFHPDGQLSLTGSVGGTYRVEFTHDLGNTSWVLLTNFTLISSQVLFSPGRSTNPGGTFYRALTIQ
jgi:outer membrane protein assembly factor BamB